MGRPNTKHVYPIQINNCVNSRRTNYIIAVCNCMDLNNAYPRTVACIRCDRFHNESARNAVLVHSIAMIPLTRTDFTSVLIDINV